MSDTRRSWQAIFLLIYAAVFLFLFVGKQVPEQKLKASIGIAASQSEVASLLEGRPIRTLDLPGTFLSDDWAALLLTKKEEMDIAVERKDASGQVVLTVETRWEVHGGLLGKAVDQVFGRTARINALTAALRSLKARAEEHHTKV